ncbi:HNH endonuclease [Gracilibacillus halophilus YIM-C55.5]|uniref:HNH endonuclease n=1 Tax=Gracilibacillus halophilus YIM-C55.5 TaxID=1308866 RepID=N4WYR9_9BACI|nr:HNH endonuclease [Gracilibacillus halophilus]ENH98191.1 HNH endonuclease [Gracilibacillus halophilus YIM-C55.5]
MTNGCPSDCIHIQYGRLKVENEYICQICGTTTFLPGGNRYAEGHHLQPLGGNHHGPDILENIIILCPNHHAEFDYCSIAINPNTLYIEHVDTNDYYYNRPLAYQKNNLSMEFLEYHYFLYLNGKNI